MSEKMQDDNKHDDISELDKTSVGFEGLPDSGFDLEKTNEYYVELISIAFGMPAKYFIVKPDDFGEGE